MFDVRKLLIAAIMIVTLAILVLSVSACNEAPPTAKPMAQVEKELAASAEKKKSKRTRQLLEATVVCRDGTEYLIGDSLETNVNGGPFAVPHYVNGEIQTCGGVTQITREKM